jgi:diguanylate cyclase (GGDEF)-like protein
VLLHIGEPQVLFPSVALLVLALIWGLTISRIQGDRAAAERAALTSIQVQFNGYRATLLRSFGQVNHTLQLLAYGVQNHSPTDTLTDMGQLGLLPGAQRLGIRISDANGAVLARYGIAPSTPVDTRILQALPHMDGLWIDHPTQAVDGDGMLQFAYPLTFTDGSHGVAVVNVAASFFVGPYEVAELGAHGLLGMIMADGTYVARRSGDAISVGSRIDYQPLIATDDKDRPRSVEFSDPIDGIERLSIVYRTVEYPVALIVGISRAEMMSRVTADTNSYLWRATGASLLAILMAALLGRNSWQLAQARSRENEAKLAYARHVEYLAYYDGLTTLPNRSLFNKLLSQAIARAHRHKEKLAVAFVDLDRFKQINDTLGHGAGDELLREAAGRLKACLRESDTVARLGGDEFVILLTDVAERQYAGTVATKIIHAIAQPFSLLNQEFRVTASIGISVYPDDGADEVALTKNADVAMYQAKDDGKNTFRFYSARFDAQSLERQTLESSLRRALDRDEFRLLYQTKRDIGSGQITGVEALLRWQHPDLGLIPPLKFLSIAEESGLIVPIGRWVLRTACEQNMAWQRSGLPRLGVSVNLTTRQFNDERLLDDVAKVLQATGIEPQLLELEIHESLLMQNVGTTLPKLTALKCLGVRIAVDDFGTGYSSLATLQRFPLDTIKIDRSYIRDVASRCENSEVTEAIIGMGKTLSLTVVAQGVETRAQADYLRTHACDEIQGFYHDKPLSVAEITKLLQQGAPQSAAQDSAADSQIAISNF